MERSLTLAQSSVFSRQSSVPGTGRTVAQGPSRQTSVHANRYLAGFTLIELLVVVAVIAILAAITLAAMGGAQQRAARSRTQAEISAIANALEAFRSQNGQYPDEISGNRVPYTNIVGYLATDRITVEGGQLKDPFGNDFVYIWPGTRNRASFDLYSTAGAGTNEAHKHIGNW